MVFSFLMETLTRCLSGKHKRRRGANSPLPSPLSPLPSPLSPLLFLSGAFSFQLPPPLPSSERLHLKV